MCFAEVRGISTILPALTALRIISAEFISARGPLGARHLATSTTCRARQFFYSEALIVIDKPLDSPLKPFFAKGLIVFSRA
ncbi:hypothetical protein D6858_12105 [Tsuneonella suprasediminis]|uniref:Uncharacterized protein n=1 Tax=Tsuneonella suprasediminis TaxID=2306996 RepID=A0A419QZ95_9SPHN|nr:hypothetical protein D6858_12105 [Tsuneonella suprasediminis]